MIRNEYTCPKCGMHFEVMLEGIHFRRLDLLPELPASPIPPSYEKEGDEYSRDERTSLIADINAGMALPELVVKYKHSPNSIETKASQLRKIVYVGKIKY